MPHFVARFEIYEGESGFPNGRLCFGDSGRVAIQTRHDESIDRATIAIHRVPNEEVLNGEVFEAECSVAGPEYWKLKMYVGYKFTICYPNDMADAEIIRVLDAE